MSARKTRYPSREQRSIIFNARRALFIYTSFHLMLALFLQLYGQKADLLSLINLIVFPLCFLVLGIWSTGNPYQAFSLAIAALVLCLLLHIYYQNLVGLGVLLIVIYYVNQGRNISFGLQTRGNGQVDILDAELED